MKLLLLLCLIGSISAAPVSLHPPSMLLCEFFIHSPSVVVFLTPFLSLFCLILVSLSLPDSLHRTQTTNSGEMLRLVKAKIKNSKNCQPKGSCVIAIEQCRKILKVFFFFFYQFLVLNSAEDSVRPCSASATNRHAWRLQCGAGMINLLSQRTERAFTLNKLRFLCKVLLLYLQKSHCTVFSVLDLSSWISWWSQCWSGE